MKRFSVTSRNSLWISAARTAVGAVLLLFLFSLPASAGWYYEAVSILDPEPSTQWGNIRLAGQSWIKDGNAKLMITESGDGLTKEGTWLVTHDGGETVYRVDPRTESYQVVNVKKLTDSIDAMLKSMGDTVGIDFEAPTVEKLAEEPGPDILGYETIRSVHRASYSITVRFGNVTQVIKTRVRREQWSTPAIDVPLAGIWLGSLQTGIKGIDQIMSDTVEGARKGFPLKTVVESSTEVQGRTSTSKSTTEVIKIEERDIDDAIFAIPPGYSGM